MKKPTEIQIGPVLWEIIWSTKKLLAHPDRTIDQVGLTEVTKAQIIVDDKLHESFQKETLLHEILHAIMATHSMSLPDTGSDYDREELFIKIFSPLLLDTMQRNPKVQKYLFTQE